MLTCWSTLVCKAVVSVYPKINAGASPVLCMCMTFVEYSTRRKTETGDGLQSKRLQAEMLQTSPPSSVHDVAFPHEYSEVFAACGLGEIRVWHLHSRRELLRMSVPNLDCRCVAFMQVCCLHH